MAKSDFLAKKNWWLLGTNSLINEGERAISGVYNKFPTYRGGVNDLYNEQTLITMVKGH